MRIHCLSIAGLCADAGALALVCATCGARTAHATEHLIEKFGPGCTVGDVTRRARCRQCGGWVVASPHWDDD